MKKITQLGASVCTNAKIGIWDTQLRLLKFPPITNQRYQKPIQVLV